MSPIYPAVSTETPSIFTLTVKDERGIVALPAQVRRPGAEVVEKRHGVEMNADK